MDGTAEVAEARRDGEALWVVLRAHDSLLKYIVEKGFIALDGTSLTICDVDRTAKTFSVMLVVHTQNIVSLPHRQVGARINVEVDVTAKYVESVVGARIAALEAAVAKYVECQ